VTDHIYKHLELTGSSRKSMEDAVKSAIARAGATVRNMHWFNVTEIRGTVDGARVDYWQVTLKAGFTLEDEKPTKKR
jgi:dodecin